VNASLDEILWTIREGGLFGVDRGLGLQLHGDEPPEFLRDLHAHGLGRCDDLFQATGHVPMVPILRAFRCETVDVPALAGYLQLCRRLDATPQAVLLDGFAHGSFGGTGKVLNWKAVRGQSHALMGLPLILAGGLTPENVAEAIATARPHGVDVASGVESSAGKKDPAKVRAFVGAAKKSLLALDS
jgi:phosphoribosylanthranilate isomerase